MRPLSSTASCLPSPCSLPSRWACSSALAPAASSSPWPGWSRPLCGFAAAKIAVALKAEKFVQLTNVPGVLRNVEDPSSLIKRIARDAIPSMIATGVISSGMIPKIECCFEALKGGVPRTHIIDGRVPHSLLIEMFSDRGVGTMIL